MLYEEIQMATRKAFPPPTHPVPGLQAAQPASYTHLLQLVDPLFHTADGGQRAERLGVQTPETVLPADLEESNNSTLLPRKRKYLSFCDWISHLHGSSMWHVAGLPF